MMPSVSSVLVVIEMSKTERHLMRHVIGQKSTFKFGRYCNSLDITHSLRMKSANPPDLGHTVIPKKFKLPVN